MQREGKKLARVARLQALGQLVDQHPAPADSDEDDIEEAAAALGLAIVSDDDDEQDGDDQDGGNDASVKTFYLWPCNVPTFCVWQCIQSQWRVDQGVRLGLDYTSVIKYMREVARVKQKDFADMFSGLQAMEAAVLKVLAEKQPKEPA